MASRLHRAAWVAAPILAVLLTFSPAILGSRTLSHRDTDRLYSPVRTLVVDALRDFRLPLWNPYEGTGKPLFAEGIHSVLHPISLIGAAIAPRTSDFLSVAYLVVAGLGALLLARTLGASPPASASAGLAYCLAGYSVSMTGNLVFLAGLSTLPWLVASARAAGAGAPWGPTCTALATACSFFSGDAQVSLVGLALGSALGADAGGARGLARAASGFAVGLLVAAVQILPTRAMLPLSYRGIELEPWERTLWALDPGRILEWIVPGVWRGPPGEIPTGASGDWLDPVFADSVFLGAPILVAAALALFARRDPGGRRTVLILFAATLFLLWLALGHHLGARQALDWLPVWNRFRYSEKLIAPLSLCVAALGAFGVDALSASRLSPAWTRVLAALAFLACLLLAWVWLAPSASTALASRLIGDAGPFHRSRLLPGLPHTIVALLSLLAIDRIVRGAARAPALALLIALSTSAAATYGVPFGARAARGAPPALHLQSDSPAPRIAHAAEKLYLPSEMADFAEATVRTASALLLPALNVPHRVDTIEPYGALNPLRITFLAEAFGPAWARAFRRFGLTHVAYPVPFEDGAREIVADAVEGGALVQRGRSPGFELWAVPHRPWAFFASRTVAEPVPVAARARLLELAVRGEDGTVILEAPTPAHTSEGRVLRVARSTETVRIEAESAGPALLVIQDAFWPGWIASIDGHRTEILAADALVRAVRWPPGRHLLEMRYDPPELLVGKRVSFFGAILLLVLAARAVARSRALRGYP